MSKLLVPIKTALATLMTVSVLGTPLPALSALQRISPFAPDPSSQLIQRDGILIAGLSFRLPVRASRFRIPGLRRSCGGENIAVDMETLQQTFVPVTPPKQPWENIDDGDVPVDHTVLPHPMILLRVPNLPGASVELTIQNEDSTVELYSTQFNLTDEDKGIVGIQVPASAEPLSVGQKFLWQAAISHSCGPTLSDFRIPSSGWIERVGLTSLSERIEQAPMRDRPALYAEAGIWQETVSTLAELRLQNPNDAALNESWSSLMQSVGLAEFATDPILHIHAE